MSKLKTQKGIYRDIGDSDYCITVEDITFYFSSKFYLGNFTKAIEKETADFSKRMEKVYNDKFNLKIDKFALIRLYELIEKRGFRVVINVEEVRCLNNVIFVSEVLTVS